MRHARVQVHTQLRFWLYKITYTHTRTPINQRNVDKFSNQLNWGKTKFKFFELHTVELIELSSLFTNSFHYFQAFDVVISIYAKWSLIFNHVKSHWSITEFLILKIFACSLDSNCWHFHYLFFLLILKNHIRSIVFSSKNINQKANGRHSERKMVWHRIENETWQKSMVCLYVCLLPFCWVTKWKKMLHNDRIKFSQTLNAFATHIHTNVLRMYIITCIHTFYMLYALLQSSNDAADIGPM